MPIRNFDQEYMGGEYSEDEERINKNDPQKRIRESKSIDTAPNIGKDTVTAGAFSNPEQYESDEPNPLDELIAKEEEQKDLNKTEKVLAEIRDKHGFDIDDIGGEPWDVVLNLKKYLDIQAKIDRDFTKMKEMKKSMAQMEKDEQKGSKYKKLKYGLRNTEKEYQDGRKAIGRYQIEIDPNKIKEPKRAGEFVRKYNLGNLSNNHRETLRDTLQIILNKMKKSRKTKVWHQEEKINIKPIKPIKRNRKAA